MSTATHDGLKSRKFLTTTAVLLVSSIALFTGKLGGGEFVTVVTLALSIYGAANLGERKL